MIPSSRSHIILALVNRHQIFVPVTMFLVHVHSGDQKMCLIEMYSSYLLFFLWFYFERFLTGFCFCICLKLIGKTQSSNGSGEERMRNTHIAILLLHSQWHKMHWKMHKSYDLYEIFSLSISFREISQHFSNVVLLNMYWKLWRTFR